VIQRVGFSRRFCTCEVVFESPKGCDMIVFTFVIPHIRRSLHSVVHPSHGFMLNLGVVQNFFWKSAFEISVNIHTDVRSHLPL
jgi:hypothetical protein